MRRSLGVPDGQSADPRARTQLSSKALKPWLDIFVCNIVLGMQRKVLVLLLGGWMMMMSVAFADPNQSKPLPRKMGHWMGRGVGDGGPMCDTESMLRVDLGGQDPPQSAYTPSVAHDRARNRVLAAVRNGVDGDALTVIEYELDTGVSRRFDVGTGVGSSGHDPVIRVVERAGKEDLIRIVSWRSTLGQLLFWECDVSFSSCNTTDLAPLLSDVEYSWSSSSSMSGLDSPHAFLLPPDTNNTLFLGVTADAEYANSPFLASCPYGATWAPFACDVVALTNEFGFEDDEEGHFPALDIDTVDGVVYMATTGLNTQVGHVFSCELVSSGRLATTSCAHWPVPGMDVAKMDLAWSGSQVVLAMQDYSNDGLALAMCIPNAMGSANCTAFGVGPPGQGRDPKVTVVIKDGQEVVVALSGGEPPGDSESAPVPWMAICPTSASKEAECWYSGPAVSGPQAFIKPSMASSGEEVYMVSQSTSTRLELNILSCAPPPPPPFNGTLVSNMTFVGCHSSCVVGADGGWVDLSARNVVDDFYLTINGNATQHVVENTTVSTTHQWMRRRASRSATVRVWVPANLPSGKYPDLRVHERGSGAVSVSIGLIFVDHPAVAAGCTSRGSVFTGSTCVPCDTDCAECPGGSRTWPRLGCWSWSERSQPSRCEGAPATCCGALGESSSCPIVFLPSGARETQMCDSSAGATGPFCSQCLPGWAWDNGKCLKCAEGNVGVFVMLFFTALSVVCLAAFVVAFLPTAWAVRIVALVLVLQQMVMSGRMASKHVSGERGRKVSEFFRSLSFIYFDVEFLQLTCHLSHRYTFVDLYVGAVVTAGLILVSVLVASFVWAGVGVRHSRCFSRWWGRVWHPEEEQQEEEKSGGGTSARSVEDAYSGYMVSFSSSIASSSSGCFLDDYEDDEDGLGDGREDGRGDGEPTETEFTAPPPPFVEKEGMHRKKSGKSGKSGKHGGKRNEGTDSGGFWEVLVERMKMASVMMAAAMYLQLAQKTLAMVHCVEVDGTSRLKVDMSVVCHEGAHARGVVLAWIMLALYVVGVPIALFVVLVVPVVRHGMGGGSAAVRRGYGAFLLRGLRPEYFFFRFVTTFVLNFGLVLSLTVLNYAATRVFVAASLFLVNACFVALTWPFSKTRNSILQIGSGLVSAVQLAIFLLINDFGGESSSQNDARTALGIVVCIAVVVVVVVALASFAHRRPDDRWSSSSSSSSSSADAEVSSVTTASSPTSSSSFDIKSHGMHHRKRHGAPQ